MNKCFGIISWLPNDEAERNQRTDRLFKLLTQLNNYWPETAIMIVSQNWKDTSVNNFKNIIRYEYTNGLGILAARKALREHFLNSNFDYLIMLDDDAVISMKNKRSAQKYLNELDEHPDGFCFLPGTGILDYYDAPLNMCAISKSIYSKEQMVDIDPQKKEGYEDSIFATLLHYKYSEYEFIPTAAITCVHFKNEDYKIASTWSHGISSEDWQNMRSNSEKIRKYITEHKELPNLKEFFKPKIEKIEEAPKKVNKPIKSKTDEKVQIISKKIVTAPKPKVKKVAAKKQNTKQKELNVEDYYLYY